MSTDAVARFGYLEDADLCQWNSTTHQYVANMQSNAINNGTEPLIIKLSLSKGTNNLGCFFSLEKITLKHTISQQTADEELAAYKVPIELSLTQLGFWDDITSVSNIVILEDTQDVMAALEMAKAEVKAAENALYASLDGKYMTFRKNIHAQQDNQPEGFISATPVNGNLRFATTFDQYAEWKAHHVEGNRFKFQNPYSGKWFGSLTDAAQNTGFELKDSEYEATAYEFVMTVYSGNNGNIRSQEDLKGLIGIRSTAFSLADPQTQNYLYHNSTANQDIYLWNNQCGTGNAASYRYSSWTVEFMSEQAVDVLNSGKINKIGTDLGQYSVTDLDAHDLIPAQTITYDNVTEELHKYELAASHLTLNMPSTNSYIEYGSTIYYINSENQLCTYPTGLYVYDNDGTPALNTYENNHNGGTPVSITEGNIARTYNIGIGNAKIDNAEVSSVGTLSVAISAAGITTFVAPVAVTLPYELTTTEIFIGQHMDDMLT